MPKPDFTLKIIKDAGELERLSGLLVTLTAFALDIETTQWWNRHRERIALIQIAFRAKEKIKVFIIDALADFDPEPLRLPLEKSSAVKVIHNAAFDATRLNKHYDFSLAPVFDTMLAARRSGERKYSLKAQAETHLALPSANRRGRAIGVVARSITGNYITPHTTRWRHFCCMKISWRAGSAASTA
jgi:DNA polymerase I-like protein with 3'-5' exonuclease and polymerase domains